MLRKNGWQVTGQIVAGLVTGMLLLGLAACGDSSGKATSPAPEDVRASAATVAAGLKQIETTAASIATAAATDKSRAKDLDGQIEPVWMTIEGTVKANDPDAYITFEDNFSNLEKAADSGDATKAQSAATAVSQAVTAYLAKYPG